MQTDNTMDLFKDTKTYNGSYTINESVCQDLTQIEDLLSHEISNILFLPIIILIGIIANPLSVLVLLKTHLKKLPSSHFLAAKSLSDTLFLVNTLVPWLDNFDISIMHKNYVCQCVIYVNRLCSFLSAHFVVGFTVLCFISVLYPQECIKTCTVQRVYEVIIGLLAFGSILSAPYLVVAAPQFSETIGRFVCGKKVRQQ